MEGKKFDTDKPQYDLIDAHALEDLAKVLTIGAQKYDRYNWVKVEPHRYEAALLRHIQAWRMGEKRRSRDRFTSHGACLSKRNVPILS